MTQPQPGHEPVPQPAQPEQGSPMYLHQMAPKPARSRSRTVAVLALVGVAGLCSLVLVVSVIRAAVVTLHDTSKLASQPHPVAATSRTPYPIESISLEPTTSYSPTPPPTTAPPTTTPAPAPATTEPVQPPGIYEEGTLLVPGEAKPGQYRATAPADEFGCYWARLRGTSGQLSDIIANGLARPGERVTVTIRASDKAFESRGCGDWVKVG